MKLKDWDVANRPRERLHKYGAAALSDAELLAILLKTGSKKENVVDMCHRLLSQHPITKLSLCSLSELESIHGIGRAKASQILSLFELSKRHNHAQVSPYPIKTAEDVFKYLHPKLSGLDRECFMVLHLDSKNRIIKDEVISIGTLNASLVHPREVFKSAIKESANAIILAHNHPSGDPTPSEEDRGATALLIKAGKLLSIKVLDHVIIGKDKWWSLNDSSD